MKKDFTLTVHCMVKNEENFVGYAIESVMEYVDRVIVFDTGSTDSSVRIIKKLVDKYPKKITFEEKGACDKKRHTELRHEMLTKTNSDWIMLLDADEVWTRRAMEEALSAIEQGKTTLDFLSAEVYLCTGDIFHEHNRILAEKMNGSLNWALGRFFRFHSGLGWTGDYGEDHIDSFGKPIQIKENKNTLTIKNKFWHLTHLRRSGCDDDDYTSNTTAETRKKKRRETYFIIGKKINEEVPEVFDDDFKKNHKLNFFKSLLFFWPYIFKKIGERIIYNW